MDILIISAGLFLALAFNFVNGLNDAANSIATVVATRALSPLKAVMLASIFNFLGPLIFSTGIAYTIGKGIINPELITVQILLIALIGSVVWVFVASFKGIPVSSSHALIGGLLGAGIAGLGIDSVLWPSMEIFTQVIVYATCGGVTTFVLYKIICFIIHEETEDYLLIPSFLTGFALIIPILIFLDIVKISGIFSIVIFIVISPMLGFLAAYFFGLMIMRLFRNSNPKQLNSGFVPLQILAACWQAIGHGANDAQNAMGMITAMLVAGGILQDFSVPFWVIILSCGAISFGTLFGGWRVVDKLANRITKIRPYQGFAASAAGGGVLSMMTAFGVPVSTTHAISGAIMGAGTTRGHTAVRWGIVREIVLAWFLTIPASAMVSFFIFSFLQIVF